MIIGDKTIDGKLISSLSHRSGKLILKECDICHEKLQTRYIDYIQSINKWKKHSGYNSVGPQDFCQKCSPFKTGSKRLIYKYSIGKQGYTLIYNNNKQRREHTVLIENKINRKLSKDEDIHHLDGIKTNNELDNLLLCSKSKHAMLHKQLENIAFMLYRQGFIEYDGENYLLNPNNIIPLSEKSYSFDDILLQPQKNICQSRLSVNISSEIIRGIHRPIPIISSNMESVTDSAFAIEIYNLGGLGILHRAWQNENQYLDEVRKIAKQCEWVAVSVGIDENAYSLTKKLIKVGANIICIDVANAYCDKVINLGKKIKNAHNDIKVIVGNTTCLDFIHEVACFADAIKVGIGSNSTVCETFQMTGHTEGQFSAVLKFKNMSRKYGIPIISDGGCRLPKDMCLALAAGANSVMLGTVLCRCPSSAGKTVYVNKYGSIIDDPVEISMNNLAPKKVYRGMASRQIQDIWKNGVKQGTVHEGKQVLLDLGESLDRLLERYTGALRSSITYSASNDIPSFQKNVRFIRS